MSKNRLDESTIQRFMGLAGLEPLGESFFDRIEENPEEEEAMDLGAEEAPDLGAEEAPDLGAEEAPADPATAEAAATMAQDVADAVADALTTALGQHGVTVDAGGEADAAPEAEMAPEDEMAPEAEMAPEEAGLEDEEPLEETNPLARLESSDVNLVDDESVVQEVARRVASRLLRSTKKQ